MVGHLRTEQSACVTNIPILESWKSLLPNANSGEGKKKLWGKVDWPWGSSSPSDPWWVSRRLWQLGWVNRRLLLEGETLEQFCLSEPCSRLHFCSSHSLWHPSAVGVSKSSCDRGNRLIGYGYIFNHLASDASTKCFLWTQQWFTLYQNGLPFSPTPSFINCPSASSEERQGEQWGNPGLWSPKRQCVFLCPLGPEVTGWGATELTSAPGPTCLPLWRVHCSQGQGKGSGVCWLWSCLGSSALCLVLMTSVLNKIIPPSNQLYGLLKLHRNGAVSGCIFNPILFSMLKKIRFFCGKTAALDQVRSSKLKDKSNINEMMGSGHDFKDEMTTLSAFAIVKPIASFIYTDFILFHD